MINKLKKAIKDTSIMPKEILEEFISCWEKVSYKKESILSIPNKTDKYLYFTISGIQKVYYLVDGKKNIISFTQPNHFSCAPESFLTQTPSKYYFECITDSVFYRLSHEKFIQQSKTHKEIQEFLIVALMGLVNNLTERYINQTTLTIEQKFKIFMENDAHLINIIQHKDIANYLSINSTNFSKLLNKIGV